MVGSTLCTLPQERESRRAADRAAAHASADRGHAPDLGLHEQLVESAHSQVPAPALPPPAHYLSHRIPSCPGHVG